MFSGRVFLSKTKKRCHMLLGKYGNRYLCICSFFRYTEGCGQPLCKIGKNGKGHTYGKDISGV